MIEFEWDPAKAASNLVKHKVSFEVATSVFRDPARVTVFDRVKDGERRWHAIGAVDRDLLLTVVFTVRVYGRKNRIRIISARKASRRERKLYV
jgi:hypothetical protein